MQRGTSTERVLQLKNLEQKGANINERNESKEDNLIEKVTTIANQHLTILAPVISDLVAVVSEKVTLFPFLDVHTIRISTSRIIKKLIQVIIINFLIAN